MHGRPSGRLIFLEKENTVFMNATQIILKKFEDGEFRLLTAWEIASRLGIRKQDTKHLQDLLFSLSDEGKLLADKSGRYGTPEQFHALKGTISGNERGFAFFVPDDKSLSDLFIPHASLSGALHKDVVYAIPVGGRRGDEGEVLGIVERGYSTIVGTFVRDKSAGYLIPDETKFSEQIYIPLKKCKNLRPNTKAVAKITSYPYGKMPGGEIVEVLGDDDDFFVEELSVIRSYHLREEFPEEVLAEAEEVSFRPLRTEGREDFRTHLVVTIDGEDTRDIDDAIEVTFDGRAYTLGVHIADVTEYVGRKSPLDKEAFARGTSVYFPDRVLPMLPKALSNGICSLNEGEDRLALSCIMTIDPEGNLTKKRVAKTVIRSVHRMTYHQVDEILNGSEALRSQFSDVVPMLERAKELTLLLSQKRRERGNVELDIKEAKILFTGDEIVIPEHETLFSYGLIEQFMVLANESVASLMTEREMPMIYRIHEKPNPEKAACFLEFARECGVKESFEPEDVSPKDYQRILGSAEPLPSYSVLNKVMLRSMQKARYSPINAGHFGLASKCYCHFTSPIRRYPDLTVHRIVKAWLDRDGSAVQKLHYFVSEASEHSSEREQVATEAEREVDELYKVQYMADRIGEEYEATISGVTSFALFTELPNTIEGMIPLETLPADEYEFVEEKFLLKGKKRSFRLGDAVKVRVEACHFDTYRVEFSLLSTLPSSKDCNPPKRMV